MAKITIGKILTRRADTERGLLRAALAPIRWRGYRMGNYAVELREGVIIRIALGSRDLSVLDQLDALVARIVAANREALVAYTGDDEEDEHEEVAWFALSPVRSVGYGGGEYRVKLPGGAEIEFRVDRWEAMLLGRYDALLRRIASRNKEVLRIADDGGGVVGEGDSRAA